MTRLKMILAARVRIGCVCVWHHRKDWNVTHETALQNLDGLCSYHHGRKTNGGWMLVEGRGKRDFVAPTDPRHPKYRRPGAGGSRDGPDEPGP